MNRMKKFHLGLSFMYAEHFLSLGKLIGLLTPPLTSCCCLIKLGMSWMVVGRWGFVVGDSDDTWTTFEAVVHSSSS